MIISFKKLLVVTALLMLAACADPRGDRLAVTDPSITIPPSLKSSMAVGEVLGGGSYISDPDAVGDSEFKHALQKSLAAHGALAEDSPAYIIKAEINAHLSDGTPTEDRRVDETVDYRVTRVADHKIFATIVKTTYSLPGTKITDLGTMSPTALGWKKSSAYDKVTSDNLAQFMQTLAVWNQGGGQ